MASLASPVETRGAADRDVGEGPCVTHRVTFTGSGSTPCDPRELAGSGDAQSPYVTARPPCTVCGGPVPVGRADRLTCGSGCRQSAYRARKAAATLARAAARRSPKAESVYECPLCETRLLGEQRCQDCGVFCRRLGPGGPCPHCDEPVALSDLQGGA